MSDPIDLASDELTGDRGGLDIDLDREPDDDEETWEWDGERWTRVE
jgi:hypothetical protein